MFAGGGVGAYQASIFHLITHAFFKALLFLGAGSVIHAMSDEQDMRKMGGLAKIPITCAVMWIGNLALAGIPPFVGLLTRRMRSSGGDLCRASGIGMLCLHAAACSRRS